MLHHICVLVLLHGFVSSRDTRSFWIIADPHIDLFYKVGSDPYNQEFGDLGCRLHSSNQTKFAGKFGEPHANCDIPMTTFKEVLEFVSSYSVDEHSDDDDDDVASFVMFLGDVPGHDVKNQTKEDNLKVMREAYELLIEYFGPNNSENNKINLVLPTLGNHDTWPIEQLCKSTSPNFKECGEFILDLYGEFVSSWLPSETVDFVKQKGYFSYILPNSLLKLISLQTQWVSIDNIFSWNYPLQSESQHDMIIWLQNELENSKKGDEKVIIFGHIPLDADEPSPFEKLYPTYQHEFLNTVEQYKDIIIAAFYGHDHTDRFYVQKDQETDEKVILVNYVCPAVVTGVPNLHQGGGEYEVNNPAVRLIKFDAETYEIVNILTFVNDIKQSNIDGSMKKNWKLEYSFLEDYKMKDLSNDEFGKLVTRMQKDDELFQKYYYYHNCEISKRKIEGFEKKKQLCMMQNSVMDEFDLCLTS